ncbi:TIM barrel protein [Phycisphaera mikurensis]|uniref:Putative sugar isomerase n=1 Tax=Phycisphaera mikurensis (strain NBRC 102666 / KCTC 22515 / FYK2301M01) TaxID=1142394 RepID=I0IIK5_PHYMF|nr:TIM barrel protein [Phycisphaera mikurensis]MBB6442752.1 L-rhamnose isomerase/sugar isomerase [Phycisphaera mikurensis]BAM05093.1 putative sugar isomerase [Phycisphaera mikurensis NBRC 102666]
MPSTPAHDRALSALDRFRVELPSWGFADTGTRFGKFFQDAAASNLEEKLHDAGHVHQLTAACPTVAVHVLWDFDDASDTSSAEKTKKMAADHGVSIGSVNPNLFQDQEYRHGSLCSPDASARERAMTHCRESIALGAAVGSKSLAMWMADGTNYPGQDSIRRRFGALKEAYVQLASHMRDAWPGATFLAEYKPFEPAFYQTDIPDWGASLLLCQAAGDNAKVLVDTGHHLPGCNIEQIVALLLAEGRLGGFHFNDRKYADDDLTLGSIDPYAVFRIFHEIASFEHDTGLAPGGAGVDYMIDQSHNLKPKLEAMVQTVCEAQKQFAKAQLVDRAKLAEFQGAGDLVGAETVLKEAYEADVSGLLAEWRRAHGAAEDPLATLRSSGVIEQLGKERAAAREAAGGQRGGGYA